MKNQKDSKITIRYMPINMSIGLSIGIAIGSATGNNGDVFGIKAFAYDVCHN